MQIPIIRASHHAMELIRCACSGSVHSVYRRTINLKLQPADPGSAPDGRYARDTDDSRSTADCSYTDLSVPPLIALQDRSCVLSPLSLCTSLSAGQLSALPVQEGQRVFADADGIRIKTSAGMIAFGMPDAAAADLNPAAHPDLPSVVNLNLAVHPALPLTAEQLSVLSADINQVLPLSPSGSFARIFCDDKHDDLILRAARTCISKTAALLRVDEAGSAAETLCEGLIGLGSGLTPGGDDFLCGVLAGLFLCGAFPVPESSSTLQDRPDLPAGPSSAADAAAVSAAALSAVSMDSFAAVGCLPVFARVLHAVIPARLSDTNDISAAFLCCACEGQFSEAVIQLAADAAAGISCSRTITAAFSRIGHTSGFDTLAGIYQALSLQTL